MARIGNKLIAICSAAIAIIYTAGYAVTENLGVQASSANTAMNQTPDNETSAIQSTQGEPVVTEQAQSTITPSSVPSQNNQAGMSTPSNTTVSIGTTTSAPTVTKKSTPAPTPASTPVPSLAPVKSTPAPTLAPVISTPPSTPAAKNQKYRDGTYSGSGTNDFGTVQVKVTINEGKIGDVVITRCATRYSVRDIEPMSQEVIDQQDANVNTISGATRSSEDFIMAVHQALMLAE